MKTFTLTGFADEIHEDLDIQLKSLQKLNIKFIEIRGMNGKSLTSYSLDEVKTVKVQLESHEIKVSAIGSPIGKIWINEPFESHFELFKHTVDIAKILNTKYIRMFSFYIPDGQYEKYQDEVFDRLKQMVKYAEDNKVILLHENEKDIYGDSPVRCLQLIQEMASEHFKGIFDFANFIQCGYQTDVSYEMLKDYIVYIHVKDAQLKDQKVVPPGLGDGKLKEILKQLIKNNYKGFLSLEPHLGDFKGLSHLELDKKITDSFDENGFEKFELALNHLKKILNHLEVGYE